MSTIEKISRKKPSKPVIKKPNIVPYQVDSYNYAVDDARKGIVPQNVTRSYKLMYPQKKNDNKPTIKPFKLSDVSKIMPFTQKQSMKLLKLSLFSHASEYDILRSSYQRL